MPSTVTRTHPGLSLYTVRVAGFALLAEGLQGGGEASRDLKKGVFLTKSGERGGLPGAIP